MRVLVLTITCGLITALQSLDPLSLALEGLDITGTWYVKAMVSNKGLPNGKRPKVVSPMTLDVLEGGRLEVSFAFPMNGQCQEMKIVMHRTEEPGKFSVFGGKLYVKPVPVKGHRIFYFEGQIHGGSFSMGKLVGRSPEVNPEALEAFRNFTQSKGLPLEGIFLPNQTEKCVPNSD